jgi:hypothetical protein
MTRTLTARSYGGVRQLSIVDEHDLAGIDKIDAARWAATSVPVTDLQCDRAFLDQLDAHSKGRIRVSEVVAARDWTFERLADRRGLALRSDVLALAALDVNREPGRKLKVAAEHLLAQLGAADRTRVSLAQVRQFMTGYVKTLANGDGIICPGLVPEPDAAAYLKDVLAVLPGAKDASGEQGVGTADLARFLAGAEEWLAWRRRGDDAATRPWGPETDAAVALVDTLDVKLEEFFLQCDLVRHQGAPVDRPKLAEPTDPVAIQRHLAFAPVAAAAADGVLRLSGDLNPAYRKQLEELRAKVLVRALGPDVDAISRADWAKVRATFDGHRAWTRGRPAEPFEKLTPERLTEMLKSPALERVRHFIDVDKAAAAEVEQVKALERLVLNQRWLLELASNLVNFSAIYHPERTALVERGSLVIDGRRLEFCVKVEDRASHKKVAADSMIFLIYVAVSGRDQDGQAPFEVASPVTAGERGRLRVGKRGIFIDIDGREWDAVVVDIVENPISIREAVVAPFRRAAAFVSKKIEELASSKLSAAEAKTQTKLGDKVATVDAPAAPAPAAAPPPAAAPAPAGGGMQNMMLMGTVAIAALGSAMAYVVSAIASVSAFELVGALLAIVGVIGALSGFLGWLKLRKRDMSLLLEANGWAVNVPMRVTRRIGGLFTRTPPFPPGTRRDLGEDRLPDDFDENTMAAARRRKQRQAAMMLVVLAFAGAVTWLAWSPDHRAQAHGWIDDARGFVTGESDAAPVTSAR